MPSYICKCIEINS